MLAAPDLAFGPGEHCVLIGPSGPGKSALLYLLAEIVRPREGEVTRRVVVLRDDPFGLCYRLTDAQLSPVSH